MTTKEVQNPGEDAEPEEESGNLGGGIAGLAFVHGPDDEAREVLRRLDPRPDAAFDEALGTRGGRLRRATDV